MLFVSYLCNLARAMGWWIVHLLIDLPKLGLYATSTCNQITLNGTYFRPSYFWRKVCRPSPVFRFVTLVRSVTSSEQQQTTSKMRSIEDLLASDNHPPTHNLPFAEDTWTERKSGIRSKLFLLSKHSRGADRLSFQSLLASSVVGRCYLLALRSPLLSLSAPAAAVTMIA